MNAKMLTDLREVNLSFLMLAQRMAEQNRVAAKAQLGIDDAICDTLANMSQSQLMRLANTPVALLGLKLDGVKLLELACDTEADPRVASLHASILGYRPAASQ